MPSSGVGMVGYSSTNKILFKGNKTPWQTNVLDVIRPTSSQAFRMTFVHFAFSSRTRALLPKYHAISLFLLSILQLLTHFISSNICLQMSNKAPAMLFITQRDVISLLKVWHPSIIETQEMPFLAI